MQGGYRRLTLPKLLSVSHPASWHSTSPANFRRYPAECKVSVCSMWVSYHRLHYRCLLTQLFDLTQSLHCVACMSHFPDPKSREGRCTHESLLAVNAVMILEVATPLKSSWHGRRPAEVPLARPGVLCLQSAGVPRVQSANCCPPAGDHRGCFSAI